MQFFATVLALAAVATAASTNMQRDAPLRTARLQGRDTGMCAGLSANPLCCETDVLSLADLNCESIPDSVTCDKEFKDYCATKGKTAECCAIQILGQTELLCSQVA